MPKFKIGDQVWAASFNANQPVRIPCSVCYGKRKVTLILGNDDRVELPCDYCAKGFDAPRGYEEEYRPVSDAKPIIITSIEVNLSEKGEEVRYHNGTYVYYGENVFATKEEALARGEELKDEWLKDERKRTDWIKQDKKKTFAWNAGYHMREVKRLEQQIIYHREKAVLCKAKGKQQEQSDRHRIRPKRF